jgi:phenylpropionate dioxygenase-like ring-hydroxylating dioxygenase large terminal subunit
MNEHERLSLERQRILRECWLYVGHEAELVAPGDFRRRRIADLPLLFVRGSDGQVRVFLNACSHQGALICRQDAGNAETFECFYHHWVFNNRGELVIVPREDSFSEAYDKSQRPLPGPPRVASLRGAYFVSFNPEIEDLQTYVSRNGIDIERLVERTARRPLSG